MLFLCVSIEGGWKGDGGGDLLWGGESQVFWVSFGRGWQITILLHNQGKESRPYLE